MPPANLDATEIKSVKTYLSGLQEKLDELGRHL
jgi:hypothetical protein